MGKYTFRMAGRGVALVFDVPAENPVEAIERATETITGVLARYDGDLHLPDFGWATGARLIFDPSFDFTLYDIADRELP